MTIEIYRSEHRPSGFTYRDLDRIQRERAVLAREQNQSTVLIAEVAPVITLGRRESETPYKNFKNPKIEILPVSRGGLATYHGTGQWVIFWVHRVDAVSGVRGSVEKLLQLGAAVAQDFSFPARVDLKDCVGLWSEDAGRPGKLGSIGISVENHVVHHGLCLNVVSTEPFGFDLINACGLNSETAWLTKAPYKRAMSQSLDSIRNQIKFF